MGWKMPAGLPEASAAGPAWRSISVTCQPRAASRSHTAAPATPAPMTIAERIGFLSSLAFFLGINCPLSISFFVPKPFSFSTAKPASSSAARTGAATLQVGSVAPGAPGGEEGQAETETGFEDREQAPPAPASGQAVALQEHVLRLGEAAFSAVIHVAVGFRIRRAVGCEGKRCGNKRHGARLT